MEHLSSIENRPLVAPNTVTYSCVIQALAKSRRAGSALQAQEVFERLLASNDIQSDVVVFTNVIDAWARDSSQNGAKRALDLLMEQMKSSDNKGVQPNAKTYTAVCRALANRGEYQATEKLQKRHSGTPGTIYCAVPFAVCHCLAFCPRHTLRLTTREISLSVYQKANNGKDPSNATASLWLIHARVSLRCFVNHAHCDSLQRHYTTVDSPLFPTIIGEMLDEYTFPYNTETFSE